MQCPYCRLPKGTSYKTKVLDTRSYWEPNERRYYIERRRECTNCKERFTTIENSPKVKSIQQEKS